MGKDSLLLPANRREPLLRGPLILTAISRVLLIPFYLICAIGSSSDLKIFVHRLSYYRGAYIVDKVALAVTLWALLLLSVLLAVLFFLRQRMFRPLMIYFSLLPLFLFVGICIHTTYFKSTHRTPTDSNPHAAWIGGGMLLAMVTWPFYYGFSPRVKRVFIR